MRILLVEQDSRTAQALLEGLSWLFMIDVADSGAQALEFLFRAAYDLIIMDTPLADSAGAELYRQIHLIDQTANVFVMLGSAPTRDEDGLIAAGARQFITKPVQIEELGTRIQAVLTSSGTPTANQL